MSNASFLGMPEWLTRTIFGALIGGIALFATLYSPLSFYALLLVVALLMYAEWLELTIDSPIMNRFGGLIYVGLPVWSMIALRGVDGPQHILALFSMVWATDIAAYIVGKRFGRHKLAPSISPGKSWQGLGGGIVCAAIAGLVCSLLTGFPLSWHQGLWVGASIAIISQCGDLFESWLKRCAGVKDSGSLIPGHGGILDRVDGLVFAAPYYALLILWLS